MRHILSFKTLFEESSEYDHPRGYCLCEFLQKELAKGGFAVEAVDNYRDIAWSVDCVLNGKRIFFFVGYLGTAVTDWQLIVCSDIGLIGWLLGWRDEEQRIELARAIHSIMSIDGRFGDLRWYSRYTDSPKDQWELEPV